jgi:hypothetical protein
MRIVWQRHSCPGYDVTNIGTRPTMSLLTERYADKISNVLSCYDRIIIQGTLPSLCYARGMTNYTGLHCQIGEITC